MVGGDGGGKKRAKMTVDERHVTAEGDGEEVVAAASRPRTSFREQTGVRLDPRTAGRRGAF